MAGRMTGDASGERLRDQDLQHFAVVHPGDIAEQATTDSSRWLVMVDFEGVPVAVARPGRPVAWSVVLANADLLVEAALKSPAFDEVDPNTGVVVLDGRDIVGVWAGDSLARALLQGPARDMTGFSLPGYPDIALIVQTCGYTENKVSCGTSDSFQRKPSIMPHCPNKNHLSPHTFVW